MSMYILDTRTNARRSFRKGLFIGAAVMWLLITTASWAVYGQNNAVSAYVNKQAELYGMLTTLEPTEGK